MKIDKKRLEAYSKEITKVCKLVGYIPSEYCFEDYFADVVDFYFIPYIKELAENCDEDEYEDFLVKLGEVIDEVYDSTVEVTLDEVKNFIKNEGISLREFISNGIKNRDIELELIVEWFIKNCNDETIQKFIKSCDDKTFQKFINWVLE